MSFGIDDGSFLTSVCHHCPYLFVVAFSMNCRWHFLSEFHQNSNQKAKDGTAFFQNLFDPVPQGFLCMILAPFWLPLWHPFGRSGLLFSTFLCRVAVNVGTILVDLSLMLAFGWSFWALVLYAVVSFLCADSYPQGTTENRRHLHFIYKVDKSIDSGGQ